MNPTFQLQTQTQAQPQAPTRAVESQWTPGIQGQVVRAFEFAQDAMERRREVVCQPMTHQSLVLSSLHGR